MIDIIGDIHGHADELEALLLKMGYVSKNGTYCHPKCKVLFVGDYIDRGLQIKETLKIVKSMVDSGNAIALMGNHEYNAICFHFQESEGGHLRKHSIKNIIQHFDTLIQFQNMQEEYDKYIDWFKTLPLYYETETFRAVHACWDQENIDYLRAVLENDRLTDDLIYESVKKGTRLNEVIEETLKGKEMKMPEGLSFKDKDGNKRSEVRIRWWEDPADMTYHSLSVLPLDILPKEPVALDDSRPSEYYQRSEKPVFFGHYWLKGDPMLYKGNVCCLDYSVAKKGKLVAYRFDDETVLDDQKFVWVGNSEIKATR